MVNISQTLALIAAAATAALACEGHGHGNGQHDVGHHWEGQHGESHQWEGQHGEKSQYGDKPQCDCQQAPGSGNGYNQGWSGETPPPPSPPAHHNNPPSGSYTPPSGPYYPPPPPPPASYSPVPSQSPPPPPGNYTPPSTPPTQTYTPPGSSAVSSNPNRATHRVIAGFNGLHFEPDNIVAEVGDLVEVHFNPMNHSFAQSSFAEPCKPLSDDAIFSGFMPTKMGEAPEVFTIEVKDKMPKWFYCSQTKGSHCQMGMAMVVNQNFDSPNTLAAYKAKAATTGESISPPKPGNGGTIAPPPNGPGL